MVSLNFSDYLGFDHLQKFELAWAEIHQNAVTNGNCVKNLQKVIESMKKQYGKMNTMYNRFSSHLGTLSSITSILDKLASDLGQLQSEFNDLEEVLALLESVCDEEEQVEQILKMNEEVHELKIYKQKELEELKVSLARDHSIFLEKLHKDRTERRLGTEKAIQSAIWKDTEENDNGNG